MKAPYSWDEPEIPASKSKPILVLATRSIGFLESNKLVDSISRFVIITSSGVFITQ